MRAIPEKFIVDTNVAVKANLALAPSEISDDLLDCVIGCVDFLERVMTECKEGGIVLDADDLILSEYRRNLSMRGAPGVGDAFLKWIYTHIGCFPCVDRVSLTGRGASFLEFPDVTIDAQIDDSDRKFIAIASAHPASPVIYQATDSKWWGWCDVLKEEAGVDVVFLCEEYVREKFNKKMVRDD